MRRGSVTGVSYTGCGAQFTDDGADQSIPRCFEKAAAAGRATTKGTSSI